MLHAPGRQGTAKSRHYLARMKFWHFPDAFETELLQRQLLAGEVGAHQYLTVKCHRPHSKYIGGTDYAHSLMTTDTARTAGWRSTRMYRNYE